MHVEHHTRAEEFGEPLVASTLHEEAEIAERPQARSDVASAAIELGAVTFPPFESTTWPACRPLVEWVTAMLPAGGTGYQRPDWDDDARAALIERFLASPAGAGFDDADHRGLLDSLLWFGTDYGPGDPLRWSPVAVEILLVDWIPRKIAAEVPFLVKAPDLLRADVRASRDAETVTTMSVMARCPTAAPGGHRRSASLITCATEVSSR